MIQIVQLTDLHVRPEGVPAYRVAETNMLTEQALRRVAALRPVPDAVIVTGDLTDCGLPAEYDLLAGMLRRLLRVPVYVIPGNHDRREVLLRHLPGTRSMDGGFVQYAVDDLPVRLVMLDTVVPGAGHGALCDARLDWLDRTLAERPDAPTLIGMHHPPFRCGLVHMDEIALRDPERFVAVVARHPQVERIVCGHHHRPVVAPLAQAIASIAPSVAHQVELDLSDDAPPAFVLEPPAFDIHLWAADTGFVSHTMLVGTFPGPFPFLSDPDYPGKPASPRSPPAARGGGKGGGPLDAPVLAWEVAFKIVNGSPVSQLVTTAVAAGILSVTIERPEKRNALGRPVLTALADAFRTAEDDVVCAVLTGAGDRAFASGGDLRELASVRTDAEARAFAEEARAALEAIRRFPVPVIAALNGDALGGGAELALACDIRLAAPHARIGFLQATLAISSAWGGGGDLFRLLGPARAIELLVGAEVLGAERAQALGLVNAVAPAGQPFAAARDGFVARFAARRPQVARAIKALALAHRDGADMARAETDHFVRTWVHDDHWTAAEAVLARIGRTA